MKPTAERVRDLFDYNEETGELICKVRRSSNAPAGSVAGYQNGDGALRLGIDGKKYLVHRVIWLWKTGEWPEAILDHENLSRHDNRWRNLRHADETENRANTTVRRNNKTGLKGVAKIAKTGLYQVNITKKYKIRCIGVFDCPAAAHFAYMVAAHETFGDFARSA